MKRKIKIILPYVLGFSGTVIALCLLPLQAQALANNPSNTFISPSTTFYAYVKTGENLDASFAKSTNGTNVADSDAVITVSRPGAADTSCTVALAAAVATSCDFNNQTASQNGVWRISFVHTGTIDDYTWTIGVQNGVTDIPGRVWTKDYHMTQHTGSPPVGSNFSFWYQSEEGYLYKADYNDYNGIESDIFAGSLGLVKAGGGCIPLYKSVNRIDPVYALAPASCNADYKLFFESPASDLPSSSSQWDSTTDWIKPPIAIPAITNVSFAASTPNTSDGTINFNLANYNGQIRVYVDVNHNGSYSDPQDVAISSAAISGAISLTFDGKDGNGNTILPSQAISFKVAVEHTAEIHFLMTDVELRGSGIAVQRLNGSVGGENIIYWDDTSFSSPDANRCSLTPQLDGTAGVDSTGGVHQWSLIGCGAPNYGNFNNYVNGSWGDQRLIDDWAYVSNNTFAVLDIAAFNNPSVAASANLADTGQPIELLQSLAAALIGISVATFFALRKQLLK